MQNKPIFFDINRKRWPKIKTGIYAVGLIGTLVLILLIGSIFINPFLDVFSLKSLNVLPKKEHISPKFGTSQNTKIFEKTKKALLAEINKQKKSIVNKTHSGSSLKAAFFVDWDDASMSSLKANLGSLDIVIGEWMHLSDGQGNISLDNPEREKMVVDYIKSTNPNTKIFALINNFTDLKWQDKKLADSLMTPEYRKKIEDIILTHIQQNGLSGVSIDFENIPLSSQGNYVIFLNELSDLLHNNNLIISVNLPASDDNFKYADISKVVDYTILMAYDEHWASSSAGPIASIDWYNNILETRSKDVPSEKMIIALGNYAYDWTDGKQEGNVLTYEESIIVAKESQGDIGMDPDSLNPTYEYYDENNVHHQVWMMDASTTFNFMQEGAGYFPAGFALWRLGSEDPTIWNFYGKDNALSGETSKQLGEIHFNYDIDYEGQGEILQVSSAPQVGQRAVNFDPSLKLITTIKYLTYPSPYVINRYGGAIKKLALTFDDGPDTEWTPQILDVLKKANVKATFFVIGENAETNPDIIKREDSEGHDIGNHTFTHPNIAEVSQEQVKLELNATERLLEGIISKRTRLFRPPYSEDSEPDTQDQALAVENINKLGYIIVGMKIDPNDWKAPGVSTIVDSAVSQAEAGKGNIILLHDAGGDRSQTVEALPLIISKLKAKGYQFVTVSELLGKKRSEIMPLATSNELLHWSDVLGFNSMHIWTYFMNFVFLAGIILGMGRLLFIVILAIWQKSKRKMHFKKTDFSVAVIVPAYNEEKVILETITSLLASNHTDKFEIIVVDDGSKDNTYKVAFDAYKDNPNIRVFRVENGGKPSALNFGIAQTQADILITLDADTVFSRDTIKNLVRHFDNPKVGAVAGNAKVGNRLNLLTRWQALEYIVSQNLDRRAFAVLNCITVVPGAVGAWRRDLVMNAGGFSGDTLAEDSDLTIAIRKMGYEIAYEEDAYGITEAPDTVSAFVRQRYRWMFGTFQAVWKHHDAVFRPKYGWLGLFALPNILLYQIVFPLISPIIDILTIISIITAVINRIMHGVSYSADNIKQILFYYALFLLVDYITGLIAFFLEKKEDKKLLVWLFLQRFFYRQLMYLVAIKSIVASLKGHEVGWNKLERKATVKFEG